jgi:hypothetical protein
MSRKKPFQLSQPIRYEIEVLIRIKSNRDFMSRLIDHLIPRLRDDPKIGYLIQVYEALIYKDQLLRNELYRELSEIFVKVSETLKKLGLEGLVICSGRDSKLTALEEIFEDICSQGGFWEHKDPKMDYHFVENERHITTNMPPYLRVYGKLRGLYVNYVSKSWEAEFAPIATKFVEEWRLRDLLHFTCNNPKDIWSQFLLLQDAWSVGGKRVSVWWERIESNMDTMWLESDNAFRMAYRNWLAGELHFSDQPNRTCEYFDRGKIQDAIDQFLYMIGLAISNSSELKGPAAKAVISEAAEEYCVRTLVAHVIGLSEEEVRDFKEKRYAVEVYEFLKDKAEREGIPFAKAITKTMVQERAGPEANRILLKDYSIIWNPIPKK